MQAYKVKGKIDPTGHLIIAEAIDLAPGDVEVIVLQTSVDLTSPPESTRQQDEASSQEKGSLINAFKELFEHAPPVPPDFDADQAKWEYLKEKHNL